MDCAQRMHREKILKAFSKYSISTGSRFKPTILKARREPSARHKKQGERGRQKQTSASTVLAGSDTEDDLEDFGKLVRTMRECAAEVKQLCYDQNISYDNKRQSKTTKSRKTDRPKIENKTLNTPRIEIHSDTGGQDNRHHDLEKLEVTELSRSTKKGKDRVKNSNQTLSPRVPHLELQDKDIASHDTPVLSDSAILSKRKSKRHNSATKHSADFRELSVDTMFSKGESLHLHSREQTATHRSATSPAVLQSAFRDPWSTFGEPLPGIRNASSNSASIYLPPLKAISGGKPEEPVSSKY